MASTTSTQQQADLVSQLTADLPVQVARTKSFARIRHSKVTLAYFDWRATGGRMNIAAAKLEKAPAKVRKPFAVAGREFRLVVKDEKGVKAGREALAWLVAKAAQS